MVKADGSDGSDGSGGSVQGKAGARIVPGVNTSASGSGNTIAMSSTESSSTKSGHANTVRLQLAYTCLVLAVRTHVVLPSVCLLYARVGAAPNAYLICQHVPKMSYAFWCAHGTH